MPTSTDSLTTSFASALAAVGGTVRQVSGAREVAEILEAALVRLGDERRLLYEPCDLAARIGLPLALSARGLRLVPVADAGERAADLPVGLTGASIAVAETGTVLVGGRPGGWGIAAVLPWVHFVLLREADIHPNLSSAFAAFHTRFEAGERDWVWVTGPSKTADIAKTLVTGIHGPNSLEVLVVAEPGTPAPERGMRGDG